MSPRAPRPRADAQRNRDRLIEAASRSFAAGERSLDAIARRAGVGAGTLYRHFPTREDLVLAVYGDQVERLSEDAARRLAEQAPAAALRDWTETFADWAATKHGMVDTLRVVMAAGQVDSDTMRGELVAIVSRFLTAGAAHGDLRTDADPDDVAALLAAALGVTDRPEQLRRVLHLIVDGLRPP